MITMSRSSQREDYLQSAQYWRYRRSEEALKRLNDVLFRAASTAENLGLDPLSMTADDLAALDSSGDVIGAWPAEGDGEGLYLRDDGVLSLRLVDEETGSTMSAHCLGAGQAKVDSVLDIARRDPRVAMDRIQIDIDLVEREARDLRSLRAEVIEIWQGQGATLDEIGNKMGRSRQVIHTWSKYE